MVCNMSVLICVILYSMVCITSSCPLENNNNKSSSTSPQAEVVENNNNKRKKSSERVISSLTDDLWTEIFLRLPLKSLLRFKSVSKSWLSIISSYRFAKSHLHRTITSGEDDETIIVHHVSDGHDDDDVDVDQLQDGPYSLSHLTLGDILENLDFPYPQSEYTFGQISSTIFGCDCGIVCVFVEVYNRLPANKGFDIYLWNPATKLSKLVPPHSILEDGRPAIGLGFDHIDLDFKLVKVVGSTFSAEVYSSNRNAWRKIEPKPVDVPFNLGFHVCLHGFLLTSGHKGMMAFDLNKEVFICNIKLPASPTDTHITDFNDSIAVSMYGKLDNNLTLWILDDEACLSCGGVNVSWTKMLIIDLGEPFDFVAGLFNSVEFLLVDGECQWFFYNHNKEGPEDLRGPLGYSDIFKYTKSLFSIAGSKPVEWTALRLLRHSDSDVEMNEESIPD